MKKVLFIGESWMAHVQETKGFDVFTYDFYEEATGYIKAALEKQSVEFHHIPSHRVELDFPKSLDELAAYDVVMISDCGANTFNLPMNTFTALRRSIDRLGMIKEYVENGGAFVMIGGYLTYQGIQARGAYHDTVIEDILPVNLLVGDDRRERCQGVAPKVVIADHPIVKELAGAQWPIVLGYNKLIPKDGAEVPIKLDDDPMVAVWSYGKGRTCAYATDCAPHWSPVEFCEWDGYVKLWGNIVSWLTSER